jgi:hypothetical protein
LHQEADLPKWQEARMAIIDVQTNADLEAMTMPASARTIYPRMSLQAGGDDSFSWGGP